MDMIRKPSFWKFLALTGCLVMLAQVSMTAQTALDRVKKEMETMKAEAAKNGTTILPDITTNFEGSKGVQVKWYNQYNEIKTIAIQKSDNKDVNFKTVGYLEKNKKGLESFVDSNVLHGTTFYRLLIVFDADMNWYSNVSAVTIDSASFVKYYQARGQKADFSNSNPTDTSYNNQAPIFIASRQVFYDIFDQQVHIRITNGWDQESQYSLVLKEPNTNKLIARINKLPQNNIILDPKNFNETGLIQFELYKDKEILEEGFLNIQ